MWSEIIDPNTGDKVSLNSRQGIQILRNYVLAMKKISMIGGTTRGRDKITIYSDFGIGKQIPTGVFQEHIKTEMISAGTETWAKVVTECTRGLLNESAINEYRHDSNLALILTNSANRVDGFALCTYVPDLNEIKLHVIGVREQRDGGPDGRLSGKHLIGKLKDVA